MSDDTLTAESVGIAVPDVFEGEMVRLPSGGWAALMPTSELRGQDVYRVRRGLDKDGAGEMMNVSLAAAIAVRVLDWRLPGFPDNQPPLPHRDPKVLGAISADDLICLEEHLMPWVQRVLGKKPETADPS